MNQKQPAATRSIKMLRQAGAASRWWNPSSLVLYLPHQPVGGFNAPHSQAFGWVATVAMADRIDQCFLQTKLHLTLKLQAANGLNQQLQQRCQLQR